MDVLGILFSVQHFIVLRKGFSPPQPTPLDDLEANPRSVVKFMAKTIFTEEFIKNNS
jgi:hypothetical protein